MSAVNGATDACCLGDSRKVRNKEIHSELMDLLWFKNSALSLQEINSQLLNTGTHVCHQWCNRCMLSRRFQEGKKKRNASRIDRLTMVRKFGNLALSLQKTIIVIVPHHHIIVVVVAKTMAEYLVKKVLNDI